MDDNCGEWVEYIGVASGCGEQEVGVASGCTMVVFKKRDSVPSARYSSICNVLRQWRI